MSLNIPKQASILEINKIYKELLYQWHPDRCKEEKEICHEKTQQIIEAYKTVLAYCEHYRFSFENSALQKNFRSDNALRDWLERFGDDPIWG